MSRILVTGADGFVGRAMVARLVAEGRAPRCAVRGSAALGAETVAIGDIGPETKWRSALQGIETVIHLAGRAHILRRDADPLANFRRVNRDGTARLARQAAHAGVRRFILISSVKAAADSSPGRRLTEGDAAAPSTPYGISKFEGELALAVSAGSMETVVLRPPLVYGPGVRANFRLLLRLIESGPPLPLASVDNRRSLIALDNLVDAVVTAVDSPCAAGGTFYIADGAPLSTPALIRALAAALGRKARLFPFPPSILAALARLAGRAEAADSLLGSLAVDDSAFRLATGWRPPVAQADAFAAVAAWYRMRERRS